MNPVGFSSILDAMRSGARAVLPKPDNIVGRDTFVEDTIFFLNTVRKCLKVSPPRTETATLDTFRECMDEISTKKELPEIILVVDRYISSVMGRALTFVHRRSDLVCENIHRSATVQPLEINIPVEGDSPLHQVMSSGVIFSQKSDHPLLNKVLYSQIGEPAVSQIVVVPFQVPGKSLGCHLWRLRLQTAYRS